MELGYVQLGNGQRLVIFCNVTLFSAGTNASEEVRLNSMAAKCLVQRGGAEPFQAASGKAWA